MRRMHGSGVSRSTSGWHTYRQRTVSCSSNCSSNTLSFSRIKQSEKKRPKMRKEIEARAFGCAHFLRAPAEAHRPFANPSA